MWVCDVFDISVVGYYILMVLVGLKKYLSDSGFFSWITVLIPSSVGVLENALGHPAVPSTTPPRPRAPRRALWQPAVTESRSGVTPLKSSVTAGCP